MCHFSKWRGGLCDRSGLPRTLSRAGGAVPIGPRGQKLFLIYCFVYNFFNLKEIV